MKFLSISSLALALLLACSYDVKSNSANAGLMRRKNHDGSHDGFKLPPFLQSHWHTKHLVAPKMTAAEAMDYYFPLLRRGCPSDGGDNDDNPDSGGGNSPGNGTSGGGVPEPVPGNWSIRNLNTVSSVYNLTVYPKNLPLFLNETDIGLPFFNENVTGRVTPLGNFSGYEDSIEYFWGLAPVPVDPSTAAISQAVVTHFTSGCPEVASSMVELTVTNVVGPNNGTFITKLKQIAFWRFDTTGRIIAYDAWIPNLQNFVGKITDPSVGIYSGGGYVPSTTDMTTTEGQICQLQAQFCTGGNQVYSSVDECIGVLMSKPYGTFDEAWGDNVVCRRVHVLLTPLRPAVHCAHVGPTGGGKCVDPNYNDVYFDDEELFGSNSIFQCPGDSL
ncbi:uncharacterized protein PV09_09331 [Verruconis gallopava]|uniref:Uncharacterized protein n=1 Tax=Verruconis gallopava TaxID=253628 RepID=A0A0D1YE13_9PEZI|nr:uncharacterized protein PV09_09331 [Verruconis gallopava]KIV98946.1 hypothetical protein PV09_09331 [Verruconis gallopava]